jgi:hypothetical protein
MAEISEIELRGLAERAGLVKVLWQSENGKVVHYEYPDLKALRKFAELINDRNRNRV